MTLPTPHIGHSRHGLFFTRWIVNPMLKFAHSVIEAGASVPELSAGTFFQNRVQLFWVPGHCGIIGSEEAEGLAGVGSKSSFCGSEPYLPVPSSVMTRVTKEWLSSNHLSHWNLVSGCRQSKVYIKRPCLKLARFLRNLPRTKLGVLIGLLTGHVRLNKHLHRMGLLSDPTCAACSIEEESASAIHFISQLWQT
jgi:hypothetical protein